MNNNKIHSYKYNSHKELRVYPSTYFLRNYYARGFQGFGILTLFYAKMCANGVNLQKNVSIYREWWSFYKVPLETGTIQIVEQFLEQSSPDCTSTAVLY